MLLNSADKKNGRPVFNRNCSNNSNACAYKSVFCSSMHGNNAEIKPSNATRQGSPSEIIFSDSSFNKLGRTLWEIRRNANVHTRFSTCSLS